ncbi:MAG: HAMP domain-containing sensor histidine kinase, partial [Cyanobacteriota bacterium]|nr:HAMP domain-containing sensor histidine kinase [Cyanobacteriota bacterium]
IRIGDNGLGMPKMTIARIFEQGYTTKDVGKGTGLGLAIAKEIVEEVHGGTLTCTSDIGRGTEFAIAIPAGEQEIGNR